jgi:hypothetical protein
MDTNVLYYGDNLDILRRYLPDAAVDLVYLDPPLRSNRDYNVIFRNESGNATDAQLLAKCFTPRRVPCVHARGAAPRHGPVRGCSRLHQPGG